MTNCDFPCADEVFGVGSSLESVLQHTGLSQSGCGDVLPHVAHRQPLGGGYDG